MTSRVAPKLVAFFSWDKLREHHENIVIRRASL